MSFDLNTGTVRPLVTLWQSACVCAVLLGSGLLGLELGSMVLLLVVLPQLSGSVDSSTTLAPRSASDVEDTGTTARGMGIGMLPILMVVTPGVAVKCRRAWKSDSLLCRLMLCLLTGLVPGEKSSV